MNNLNNIKNQKFNEVKIVEILFYTFPLWFVVGNLLVSLNTILFIVFSLFLIKKRNLKFRFDSSCWFLILFFTYLFFSTTTNYLIPGLLREESAKFFSFKYDPIFKSFMLSRFVILILLIDTLFYNKILNLKKFLFVSILCTTFVSLDIILQFYTGTDLFGFKSFEQWNSGPFGDEKIAGGFLKNFSFFSFFYIFLYLKEKKNFKLLSISAISIHLIATLMSANRMPLILFLFGIFIIFLIIKNIRILLILSIIIFISASAIIIKNNKWMSYTYKTFYGQIDVTKFFSNDDKKKQNQSIEEKNMGEVKVNDSNDSSISPELLFRESGYNRVWRSSYIMLKEKLWVGSGLKSFRIKCWKILSDDTLKNLDYYETWKPQRVSCGQHQHQYYLQVLGEAGLIGSSFLFIFFAILLKTSFLYIRKYIQTNNNEIFLLIPFIISIFLEIWPLRSSGSFFTTWNATFIWLNVGVLIAHKHLIKDIFKNNN